MERGVEGRREEEWMRVWKLGPVEPCTNFPQGDNSKSYQAAPPPERGART